MGNMSRMAVSGMAASGMAASGMAASEYIGTKRRAYAQADRAKRIRILDEMCETTGYGRKYANRLLPGNQKIRGYAGRGKHVASMSPRC